MFDVKAKQSVSIKSLKMYIGRGAIAEVWTKVGTYDGFENSIIGWTKVAGEVMSYYVANFGEPFKAVQFMMIV
jgi:hypothetical protein